MALEGGDWSGQPGHRCGLCGRSSEFAGLRGGFDHANDMCGGCCELSSDDDGHNKECHCRSCKAPICKNMSEIDNHCCDCVGECKNCGTNFKPHYLAKCSMPLDEAVMKMTEEEEEDAVEVLGHDAKSGDAVCLCKECNKEWRKHPQRGKKFEGFPAEKENDCQCNCEKVGV